MSTKMHALAFATSLLACGALNGQTCSLVKDINTVGQASSSRGGRLFYKVGDAWVFVADHALTGPELWRTDGTLAGTRLLKDVNPGPGDPLMGAFLPCKDANGRDVLYFTADDGVHGPELWFTNGTTDGTFLVADLAGPAPSFAVALGCIRGVVYFSADDPLLGRELWKLTATGPALVKDIRAGIAGSRPGRGIHHPTGNRILFVADDGMRGEELWCTDGTASGTVCLDVRPGAGASVPRSMHNHRGWTLFSALGPSGRELYRTDCTAAGTRLLKDIDPGPASSDPAVLGPAIGNDLFFVAGHGSTGRELYKTDGTTVGTKLVCDLAPGVPSSSPVPLAATGNTLYFSADLAATGRELYRLDGNSCTLVRDIRPGREGSDPWGMIAFAGKLLFLADDGTTGPQIWQTTGTAPGTVLMKDLRPATAVGRLTVVGPRVLFAATDPVHGEEPWSTDGTAAGTRLFADLWPGQTTESASPQELTACFGGDVYFRANDGVHGAELWRLTATGPHLVKDIYPGRSGSQPQRFTCCWTGRSAMTLFAASDGSSGIELWRTDGTATGTRIVKDIRPGPSSSDPRDLVCVGGRVYFTAIAGNARERQLWVSDGTATGTVLVKRLHATGSDEPRELVGCKGKLFFTAQDGKLGRELYVTDGTEPGTTLVKDIRAGALGSAPAHLVPFGDQVLFAADDGSTGIELWASDGTAAGTTLLRDIYTGRTSSTPNQLTVCRDLVFFSATDAAEGTELWATDGTTAGTRRFIAIGIGTEHGAPRELTCNGIGLFFTAFRSGTGREPYFTDGTKTWPVRDIEPGPQSSTPTHVTSLGDKVYFAAHRSPLLGGSGRELWSSDASSDGTRQVCDIGPGATSSDPSELVTAHGRLYFVADDGTHGAEIWKVEAPGAHLHVLGDGSRPHYSELTSSSPIVGRTAVLQYSDGPDEHTGLLFVSAPSAPYALAGVLAEGAGGWVDLATFLSIATVRPPTGFASLPIPNATSLIGAAIHAQIWWIKNGTILPIGTTNGLALRLGK